MQRKANSESQPQQAASNDQGEGIKNNEDVWVSQKAQKITEQDQSLSLLSGRSTSRLYDFFQLFSILLRSFLHYPRTCVRALKFSLGTKIFPSLSHYEPSSPAMKKVFDNFDRSPWPMEGSLTLPNEEAWDDYLVFAHNFGLKICEEAKISYAWPVVTKIRWGIAHGLYNAVVHGALGNPLEFRWRQTPTELQLNVINVGDETRLKPHPVSYEGIPISGVGGSMMIMNMLFDSFELTRSSEQSGENHIHLSLTHRFKESQVTIRRQVALHIAAARDKIQLERIIE